MILGVFIYLRFHAGGWEKIHLRNDAAVIT
jgi:hypothetical protein